MIDADPGEHGLSPKKSRRESSSLQQRLLLGACKLEVIFEVMSISFSVVVVGGSANLCICIMNESLF